MSPLLRALVAMAVAYLVCFVTYRFPFSLTEDLIPYRLFAASACGVAAGWIYWRSGVSKGLLTSVAGGALLLGTIGFVAGFVGPILFAPEANQGPLLGILITGPLGFLLGGIA